MHESTPPSRDDLSVVELPVGTGSVFRLGVVADTHSQPHPVGLEHLAAVMPQAILHAGDIGELGVIDRLRAVAPTYAVRGNIDGRAGQLPESLVLRLTQSGRTVLTILLTHIGLANVRLRPDAARLARAHGASLVVCGHSHVPFIGEDRGLTVFNPGSMGPRRFHLPIVFGVLELEAARVHLRHVDCLTGGPWLP